MQEPDPYASILGSLAKEERLVRAAAMGVPAFVRRAQAVEGAIERLHARIAAERAVRMRALASIGRTLDASARAGEALPAWAVAALEAVRAAGGLAGRPARPARSLDRALAALAARILAFNKRWRSYLASVPLDEVHAAQAAYNRYYAIEREMALPGAPPAAFVPLVMLERAELAARFQGLPAPA